MPTELSPDATQATATDHRTQLETDRPDLAGLLKATADTMAAVNAATARLEEELEALRSRPLQMHASTPA